MRDIQIQTETYKLLCRALEQKDFNLFKSGIKSCKLTNYQLQSLKALAITVGCELSTLADIQTKLDMTVSKSTIPKNDKPKPKNQKSLPNKNSNASRKRKTEVIGFTSEILRYCVFDYTVLQFKKNIHVTPNLILPGYLCPNCNSIYINYKDLPPRKSKQGKYIYVHNIREIVSNHHPTKGPKKKPEDNINPAPPDGKKQLVYVSSELPPVCHCKCKNFEYTKYFFLRANSVRFSGKYCSSCMSWFITTETFEKLSPLVQSMIDRKPVTWIKPPVTPIGDGTDIIIPLYRPLFWWEKQIHVQDTETSSAFSSYIGTGKQILQVTFGIDFGASTTKVVIRNKLGINKPSWRALIHGAHFACEDDSDKTLAKSQIYISDTGRIGLGKEGVPGWKARPYFKAVLVDRKYHTQDLDEVYYAIFFIATILKTIEEHVKRAYPPAMYSSIDVKIAMGMPIRGAKGRLVTVFDNILRIADELKGCKEILLSDGVDFESWKTLCKESHGLQKTLKPHLLVRPELYSEVVGLFNSSYGPTHRALVIDIGSATLDIAYVYTEPPIQNFIYIPIAEVAPVGVEVAASRLVSSNCTVFPTLQDAREYLMTYSQRRVEDKDLVNVVQELLKSCMPKIQRVEHVVFGHALVQPTIPIYFYGGGRDAKWFKFVIDNTINSRQKDLTFTMPKMQIETIPRVPDQLLHRFQVALGLSNCGEEKLPLRSLPKDHEFLWCEIPFIEQKRYIDLEELQKNLYGC